MDFTKPKSTPTKSTTRIELPKDARKRICLLCGFINENQKNHVHLFKNVLTKTQACTRIENELGIEVPSLAHETVICKTCDKNIAKIVKNKDIIKRLSAENAELQTKMIRMYETGIEKMKSQFGITLKYLLKYLFGVVLYDHIQECSYYELLHQLSVYPSFSVPGLKLLLETANVL